MFDQLKQKLSPFFAGVGVLFLVACSSQQQQQVGAPSRIPSYHYHSGSTRLLSNGRAIAPADAPPQVKRLVQAANSLVGKPYRMGGGHRKREDSGYDCSGSISYALSEAGLMTKVRHSNLFMRYGRSGPGKWVSIYVRNGHVFMVVCGLRFDTTGRGRSRGPGWRPESRSTRGFYVRHPYGF
ncbi:MAG: peptidoglycan endopeptidase [Akkermansia sp.]